MIEQPEKRITNNRNISCRKSLQSTQTFIICFRKPQITITCDVPRPPNRYRQYYKKYPITVPKINPTLTKYFNHSLSLMSTASSKSLDFVSDFAAARRLTKKIEKTRKVKTLIETERRKSYLKVYNL